jgi:Mg/Co/Ni transporter MgtE
MHELLELRKYIEAQDYQKALQIVDELEEMSLEDKLNKISSYLIILLTQLIKEQAEGKLTNSWQHSINNSVFQINKTNKRRKAGGYYAQKAELIEMIEEVFDLALERASLEAFGGSYSPEQLQDLIDRDSITTKAISLIDLS